MGLLVTAAVALGISRSGFFPSQIVMMLAIFAQLGIVIGLSWAINRISATTAGMLFFVYSALTWLHFFRYLSSFFARLDCGGFFKHGRRLRRDDGRWANYKYRPEQVLAATP